MAAFSHAGAWHIDYNEGYTKEGLEVMKADGLQVLEATEEMKDYTALLLNCYIKKTISMKWVIEFHMRTTGLTYLGKNS